MCLRMGVAEDMPGRRACAKALRQAWVSGAEVGGSTGVGVVFVGTWLSLHLKSPFSVCAIIDVLKELAPLIYPL